MKKLLAVLTVLMMFSMFCETAEARRRWRRTNYTNNVGTEWTGAVGILKADQAACQKEAKYMAANYIRGHVFGVIGFFEGCGWGAHGKNRCGTCLPGWNATLTGDFEATSASGEKFRVRSWR